MLNAEQKQLVEEIIKDGDSAQARLQLIVLLCCHARDEIFNGWTYGAFGSINYTSLINVAICDWQIIVDSVKSL